MPVPDYTNLEEAWDAFPTPPDLTEAFEVTFYAGAQAVLWLLTHGRSLKTLDMEIGDWIACHQEMSNAARH